MAIAPYPNPDAIHKGDGFLVAETVVRDYVLTQNAPAGDPRRGVVVSSLSCCR